ncbi:MAG: hypothetical protein WC459_01490 [Patescibacteria group bacterium]
MKITALLITLLFSLAARAEQNKKILSYTATEQIFLRDILAESEKINKIKENKSFLPHDSRILHYDSHDWFWKPRYLEKKVLGFEFQVSAESGTPVIIFKF